MSEKPDFWKMAANGVDVPLGVIGKTHVDACRYAYLQGLRRAAEIAKGSLIDARSDVIAWKIENVASEIEEGR